MIFWSLLLIDLQLLLSNCLPLVTVDLYSNMLTTYVNTLFLYILPNLLATYL